MASAQGPGRIEKCYDLCKVFYPWSHLQEMLSSSSFIAVIPGVTPTRATLPTPLLMLAAALMMMTTTHRVPLTSSRECQDLKSKLWNYSGRYHGSGGYYLDALNIKSRISYLDSSLVCVCILA